MRRYVEPLLFGLALSVLLAACATNTATPSAAPTAGACTSGHLVARITPFAVMGGVILGWHGAAGSRFADVELTNTGPACTLAALARPQLIDGHGAVVIDGPAPGASALLWVGPGHLLKTVVTVSDYCGPRPAAPVTAAFVLNGGTDRVVALPVSTTDTDAVPPCSGPPAGAAGHISMRAWAP